jgi:hypothetical protein
MSASVLAVFVYPEVGTSISMSSFFIFMDHDIQFIVRDDSFSLHFFIPYGYLHD